MQSYLEIRSHLEKFVSHEKKQVGALFFLVAYKFFQVALLRGNVYMRYS